jgi:von Willebrand factor type A domain/Aerotolerance regulator N-terminal
VIGRVDHLLASGAKTAVLELLSPAGLGLLALLVPLVVLYILKVKRAKKRVASTWLWATAQRDLMARSPFKRLIAQVPLLVQALALILLALALARPATRGREFTGDHVAIVIDTSASMTSTAPGSNGEPTTRIALAKQSAKDLLSALTPGSDALILEAGRDARLVAPLDRDLVRVRAAIDRVEAEDVEGDLGAAVALAVDRLRQLGGSRRIVVLTDGNLSRPSALAGASLPVEVITVGAPVENAAIVRVDVRSGTDAALNKEQVQGFLVVANFGRSPRDVYVTMREQNASDVLASRRVLVQPGERLPVVLTFHPTVGDYRKGLLFEISPHDSMPVDDVAYGRVPAGDKLPVYLAGSSPWIERALVSDPMVDLHTGTPAELAADTWVGLDTFVVIDGACPVNAPGGDVLIVHPPPGKCFGTLVGATIEHPEITSWENADPRMRFLTLDGVHVRSANALKPDGATQELVRTQQGTIATDISTTTRTGTLVGFDVGDSDWPLKASFVLFMRNLLEQARAHRQSGISGPARAGEPMRVSLPGTATLVEATGPRGEKVEVSQRGSLAVVPDIRHVGFYEIAWKGPQAGSTLVPANLTSVAESDLTPKPIETEGSTITVTSAAGQPDAHTEWTWLLALIGLGLVVFDVWYFTRDPRARSPVGAPPRPRMPERKAA